MGFVDPSLLVVQGICLITPSHAADDDPVQHMRQLVACGWCKAAQLPHAAADHLVQHMLQSELLFKAILIAVECLLQLCAGPCET